MRVLVTGAAGFLGTHLVNAITRRGWEAFILFRDVNPHPLKFESVERITQILGDVQSLTMMRRVISTYEIDMVVHLAAQTQVSVGVADPETMFRENIMGALSVLEACRLNPVKRVIIASTDKVYGSEPLPYNESSTRLAERTPYGASKVCVDVMAQTYLGTYHMPVSITRCGNLYGPGHLNWSALIPGTIRKLFRGEKPVVKFGGLATRDFLHVDDAVAAYMALMEQRHYGPFNFSGGAELKVMDVVKKIADVMGKPHEFEVTSGDDTEIVQQHLDCSKANEQLKWFPTKYFDVEIKETVKWYVDHLTTR